MATPDFAWLRNRLPAEEHAELVQRLAARDTYWVRGRIGSLMLPGLEVAWFQNNYGTAQLSWLRERLPATDYDEFAHRLAVHDLYWVRGRLGEIHLDIAQSPPARTDVRPVEFEESPHQDDQSVAASTSPAEGRRHRLRLALGGLIALAATPLLLARCGSDATGTAAAGASVESTDHRVSRTR